MDAQIESALTRYYFVHHLRSPPLPGYLIVREAKDDFLDAQIEENKKAEVNRRRKLGECVLAALLVGSASALVTFFCVRFIRCMQISRPICNFTPQCAQEVHRHFDGYKIREGVTLRLHSALSAGHMTKIHVGGYQNRWEFLVKGDPLTQLGLVGDYAKAGWWCEHSMF